MLKATFFILSLIPIGFAQHHEGMQHSTSPTSPYVDQFTNPIAGLSQQEIDDLLAGRGMGLARSAELSSYPGPTHLLEFQKELALTSEQITQIEAIFKAMNAKAVSIGEHIVDLELALSDNFRNKAITSEMLQAQTEAIALQYGQLRSVHLNAHLEVTPLLATQQIEHYNLLRGYK